MAIFNLDPFMHYAHRVWRGNVLLRSQRRVEGRAPPVELPMFTVISYSSRELAIGARYA